MILLAAALVFGCARENREEVIVTTSTPTTTVGNETAQPGVTPTADPLAMAIDESSPAEFTASDGVQLDGRLFGVGDVGVVLSHMGRPGDDQSDWFGTARYLADRGYMVLTYNRRGVCPGGARGCSEGRDGLAENWMDVLGAVSYMRQQGIESVVAAGASIGAMASAYAAEQQPSEIDGLIWIAGVVVGDYRFEQADVSALAIPKLYISARQDVYGAADSAQQMYEWSIEPKDLLLVKSSAHGTDMLAESDGADEVKAAIVDFLTRHWPNEPPEERQGVVE